MESVRVIAIDPAHTPLDGTSDGPSDGTSGGPGGPRRGLLYPLWVMALDIKPYPGARSRSIWFSVDAVRGVPLPIKDAPATEEQPVPEGTRLLDGVDQASAVNTTIHFTKKGLGALSGWMARVQARDVYRVYKVFWIVDGEDGEMLIDSRSGKKIPLPADLGGPPGR